MKRDFLTLKDFSRDELLNVIKRAQELKKYVKDGKCPKPLENKVLAMIFEKPSTRTRVSFEVGMIHLGGSSIYLNQTTSQLGRGETYSDTARVLSRYVNGIVFRTFSQDRLDELAKHSTVPVINGLTDLLHPCQIVADLVTLTEHHKNIQTMTLSYVGDGNNYTHSWMMASSLLGFNLKIATPHGYEVDPTIQKMCESQAQISYSNDPEQAVKDCDVVSTDTWFSMGQEVTDAKRNAFSNFQVNSNLMKHAKKDAVVLHLLPAHRGEEITDEVMDGPQSIIFDQAENRLFGQMAVLEKLLGEPPLEKRGLGELKS